MGISISTNTQGLSNVNAFVSQKVGDENCKTLAGLFANVNLGGAPMLRGIFAETYLSGHSFSLSYAQIVDYGVNMHASVRVNIFKNEMESYDFSVYGNEVKLLGDAFKVARCGGNLSWSTPAGHAITIGASQSFPINSVTIEASVRVNLWKSDNGSTSCDLTTNLTQFVKGPLVGLQDAVASLTFSHAF